MYRCAAHTYYPVNRLKHRAVARVAVRGYPQVELDEGYLRGDPSSSYYMPL